KHRNPDTIFSVFGVSRSVELYALGCYGRVSAVRDSEKTVEKLKSVHRLSCFLYPAPQKQSAYYFQMHKL
ncbi:MAG: hypothetical protein QXF50_01000, partial [Sulfolobales archaeon]